MATFKWTGKTLKGTIESGRIKADSKEAVMSLIRRQGIIPTSISEEKAIEIKLFGKKKKKIKERDIVIFTRQFATMFAAGIPVVQGLDIIAKQASNKALALVLSEIKAGVEAGETLSDAMKKHPTVFDTLYVNMVAAGEAGGVLDTVLLRLAGYIEKAMKLKKKVKGAMIYPAIVVSVAALVIGIIVVFVIPVFSKIFSEMGARLPFPTRIVIGISNFLGGIGGLILLGGGVASILGI
ncbi:MAG: type II secretion system F family protein, partial [Nitrospirae bacterium]|nr:type II secretion system F family protein [Nitrospirota bacterium]